MSELSDTLQKVISRRERDIWAIDLISEYLTFNIPTGGDLEIAAKIVQSYFQEERLNLLSSIARIRRQ